MKITFRVHIHTDDEIQMGHKLGFTGIEGVDAVSATANVEGFTPLNAAVRAYGWDRDLIAETSAECNRRQETAIFNHGTPTLFLVPRLIGRLSYKYTVEGCAIDLLMACKHLKIKRLHFTHFGFMQSLKAKEYFVKILEIFMNPLIEIPMEELIWEIDLRGLRALQAAYHEVRIRFHLPEQEPMLVMAPRFEYGVPIDAGDDYSWREFIPSDL